jgi:hypothetical protein
MKEAPTMANMLDLKHHRDVFKRLRDAAEDPELASIVVEFLDENPEIREDLSGLYVRAKRTMDLEADRLKGQ